MNSTLFIGPLPPPIGGLAVINQSFQNIDFDSYKVISFDTAEKRKREDLYSKFKFKSIRRNLKLCNGLLQIIEKEQPDIVNIFVTRDQ